MNRIIIQLDKPADVNKLREISSEKSKACLLWCEEIFPFVEDLELKIESDQSRKVAIYKLTYGNRHTNGKDVEEEITDGMYSLEIWMMFTQEERDVYLEYKISENDDERVAGHRMEPQWYRPLFELFHFLLRETGAVDLMQSKEHSRSFQMITRKNAARVLEKLAGQTEKPVLYISRSLYNDIVFDYEVLECLCSFCEVFVEEEQIPAETFKEKLAQPPVNGSVYLKGIDERECSLEYKPKAGQSNITPEKIFGMVEEACSREITYMSIRASMDLSTTRQYVESFNEAGLTAAEFKRSLGNQIVTMMGLEKTNDDLIENSRKLTGNILSLKKENEKLRQELNYYKANDNGNSPVLFQGSEKELFAGETKEIVMSVLSTALGSLAEGSRRKDVIEDLVAANHYQNILSNRKDQLKNLFKKYKSMNPELESRLSDLGINIKRGSKHYILSYYDDPRYTAVMGKTSSDFRSGANNISRISRSFL